MAYLGEVAAHKTFLSLGFINIYRIRGFTTAMLRKRAACDPSSPQRPEIQAGRTCGWGPRRAPRILLGDARPARAGRVDLPRSEAEWLVLVLI